MPQYLEDGLGLFCLALIAVVFFGRLWLSKLAYLEVSGTPRIPMVNCDKHGLLPADAMHHTTATAVGRPDLDIVHCPICYGERLKTTKETLAR